MKIVLVTWRDAHADNEEHSAEKLDELHEPYIWQSVGFLYRRDSTGITLIGCHGEEDAHDRRLFIDAGMIDSVVILRR